VNCDEFVELVTAFLEGTLSPEDERRMTDHLAECDGCTTYLGQFRSTVDALNELKGAELTEENRSQLLDAFRRRHV
jgi:anti-sigma factor RsiW